MQYATWGSREFMAALRVVLSGRIAAGPAPARIAERLSRLAGGGRTYAVNAGRTAIWLGLQSMRALRPGRDRVVVPAYLCPGVVSAVERAGATWTAADVGADLNIDPLSVASVLDERTLAVIVPHMYGCPARIAEIERIAAHAGAFVIDDAAQIVGVESDGRMLGGCGDIGIQSFAQSKSIVTGVRGSGGMLIVNNPILEAPVRALYGSLRPASGRAVQFAYFVCQYLLSPYLGPLRYHAARAVHEAVRWAAGDDYFEPARMSNLDAAIAEQQLGRLASLRREKVRVAGLYAEELRRLEGVEFPQFSPGRYLTRIMVALPPGREPGAVRQRLSRAGIHTRAPYSVLEGAGGRAEIAESWARRLIELPSRVDMNEADVRAVCGALAASIDAKA